jgi:hypothetical protein
VFLSHAVVLPGFDYLGDRAELHAGGSPQQARLVGHFSETPLHRTRHDYAAPWLLVGTSFRKTPGPRSRIQTSDIQDRSWNPTRLHARTDWRSNRL